MTTEKAKIIYDSPTFDELKCCECGAKKKEDKNKNYESQSRCICGDQMMGMEWNGWYNMWRDLALNLLKEKEA